MKWWIVFGGVLLLSVAAVGQKSKKAPEVEVVETHARRDEGKILIDARVKALEKPIKGLTIFFDLLSAENGVVQSERTVPEEQAVDPGDERSTHAETSDPARAVRYRVRIVASGERELRVANSGPFPIE